MESQLAIAQANQEYTEGLEQKLGLYQVPDIESILTETHASTQENLWAGFDANAAGLSALEVPGLQVPYSQLSNLESYSEGRQPEIAAFNAQYGEVGDGFWGTTGHIVGVTGGGLLGVTSDTVSFLGGVAMDGTPGVALYNLGNQMFGDGSTLGNQFSNTWDDNANGFMGSFGPNPVSGGFFDPEVKAGVDAGLMILGGAGLLNQGRHVSVLDDLVPTPNHGSPNRGTFAGATDGEMIGQPSSPMFNNPYSGDQLAPNFVGPARLPDATEPAGDIFVMIDGNIVRVGGSNNNLPGAMIDNRQADLDFYNNVERANEVGKRPSRHEDGAGFTRDVQTFISELLENMQQ